MIALCPNPYRDLGCETSRRAAALLADAERIIGVAWADEESAKFPVTIHIMAKERPNLLMDISQLLANLHINLRRINAKMSDDGAGVDVSMSFDVQNAAHLDTITRGLLKIPGVNDVSRQLNG